MPPRASSGPHGSVAIIDFHLYGPENGVAVAQRLRRSGARIIYTTADPECVRKLESTAVVVSKPYDINEVLLAIQRAMAPIQAGK